MLSICNKEVLCMMNGKIMNWKVEQETNNEPQNVRFDQVSMFGNGSFSFAFQWIHFTLSLRKSDDILKTNLHGSDGNFQIEFESLSISEKLRFFNFNCNLMLMTFFMVPIPYNCNLYFHQLVVNQTFYGPYTSLLRIIQRLFILQLNVL